MVRHAAEPVNGPPYPITQLGRLYLSLLVTTDALADRVLYFEAAVLHLADLAGLDLSAIPDPMRWGTP